MCKIQFILRFVIVGKHVFLYTGAIPASFNYIGKIL